VAEELVVVDDENANHGRGLSAWSGGEARAGKRWTGRLDASKASIWHAEDGPHP
jgi:hypothetical protein